MRKQISKKLRFEIFHRDGFACQYCGATPPSVVLHVDHVFPVKSGGTNDQNNLITSCESCNLGKSAKHLSDVPLSIKDRSKRILEIEDQLKGYNEILLARADRIDQQAWMVVAALEGVEFAESYNRSRLLSIKRFLELIPVAEVMDAAEITLAKCGSTTKDRAFKYFCAVCWNKIRGSNNGQN